MAKKKIKAPNDKKDQFPQFLITLKLSEQLEAAQSRQAEIVEKSVPYFLRWRQCAEQLERWEAWEDMALLLEMQKSGPGLGLW